MIINSGLSSPDAAALFQYLAPGLGVNNSYKMDIIDNCLLLRRDVHSSFDDYQFGIYHNGSYVRCVTIKWLVNESEHFLKFRIIIFEKTGASTFSNCAGQPLFDQTRMDTDILENYPGTNFNSRLTVLLLKHHFTVGLLRHVAGYGQSGNRKALGAYKFLSHNHFENYKKRLNPNYRPSYFVPGSKQGWSLALTVVRFFLQNRRFFHPTTE